MTFLENPFSGSSVVACGETERQEGIDTIVAFHNSAK
jgi:hypothetical protein